jgi:hypothetical protein
MKFLPLLLALILQACSLDGRLDPTMPAKKVSCTDTRDGEKFWFSSQSISDVKVGYLGADTCFNFEDDRGLQRRMCESYEAFIKCASEVSK